MRTAVLPLLIWQVRHTKLKIHKSREESDLYSNGKGVSDNLY